MTLASIAASGGGPSGFGNLVMSRRRGYNAVQIALHWAVAGLVVFNYIYSEGMEDALDARLENVTPTGLELNPAIHVWVGVAILALVLLRFVVRLTRGVPAPAGSGMQQTLAEWAHRLMYALLIAVPALGMLTWFGQIDLFGEPHAVMANLLMLLAGGHAFVAIGHHVLLKDGLLGRMMRPDAR